MDDWNIPKNVKEIFENGTKNYHIKDNFIEPMDNIESMNLFLEAVEIPEKNISIADGTQVILCHPEYDFEIRIDSGGLGDFYSHGFFCTKVDFQGNEL